MEEVEKLCQVKNSKAMADTALPDYSKGLTTGQFRSSKQKEPKPESTEPQAASQV